MKNDISISERSLSELRSYLGTKMSQKRYRHTCEVEKMAVRLGELFCPDKITVLRAAALLHDITKENTHEKQLQICEENGIIVSAVEAQAHKTFHAKTAAAIIPQKYPEFASDEVIGAVRWHTTGRAGMTLTEKLIYLADYIDMSRSFDDCVVLRRYFWGAEPENMSDEERLRLLDDTLIRSYDMTIKCLLEEGSPISDDTFAARNDLVCQRIEYIENLKKDYRKESI